MVLFISKRYSYTDHHVGIEVITGELLLLYDSSGFLFRSVFDPEDGGDIFL
jgi:hypothetical protein